MTRRPGPSSPASTTPATGDARAVREPAPALGLTLGIGLQGKLVLCFCFLLASALGASCWLFVSETRASFDVLAGQQARQLSRTLAMASEPPLERGDAPELRRIGAELTKNHGLVAVAFFDAAGRQVAVAARDPDVERAADGFFPNPRERTADLRTPTERWTAALGRYVELTAPVTRISGDPASGRPAGQLLGYVTVCLSEAEAGARARNVGLSVVLIGAVAVLVSLPTMYLLVHRVFAPIRQLVAAADRIAAGDLDAHVEVGRPDVIGTLARSFNEMVNRVRAQQEALGETNARLEGANAKLAAANARLAEANVELYGANNDLEQKVRARTAELERANGRLSSEIAEKDEFLRTVSHDLNAPLRNIAGMAAMLLLKHRASFDPDVVHRLERIQKNVEIETDLIGELLELSRIKTRRHKPEPVALGAVVREVGELVAQDLETRGITFVVDAGLPTLVCERARFRQVFQNLIDNAIKYMGDGSAPADLAAAGHPVAGDAAGPDGRVRAIHVGCRAGGEELEFYVRDTGIGIDEADLGNVFRVFRRGKSQAVQAVAGKGVGLASVKSIVETYGGTIRVESRPGAGSTFRFTIDRKHLADPSGPAAAAATTNSEPENRAA